jgi:hypothetical protein
MLHNDKMQLKSLDINKYFYFPEKNYKTKTQIFLSFMIVIISPTHAQFTSLLCTLAYMFRPHRAIIMASPITKECRLKCVSMNKILEFYKTNG